MRSDWEFVKCKSKLNLNNLCEKTTNNEQSRQFIYKLKVFE